MKRGENEGKALTDAVLLPKRGLESPELGQQPLVKATSQQDARIHSAPLFSDSLILAPSPDFSFGHFASAFGLILVRSLDWIDFLGLTKWHRFGDWVGSALGVTWHPGPHTCLVYDNNATLRFTKNIMALHYTIS